MHSSLGRPICGVLTELCCSCSMNTPKRHSCGTKAFGGLKSQGFQLATALGSLAISALLLQQVLSLQEELRQLGRHIRNRNSSVLRHQLPVIEDLQGGPDTEMRDPYLSNHSLQALLHGSRDRQRARRDTENCTSQQPFLHLVPAKSQPLLVQGDSSLVPWAVSLRQGNVLDVRDHRLVVAEDSYYLVFGQVLYQENGIPMGHLIQRKRLTLSGIELKIMLRCVKNMPDRNSNTSCYTAGVLKLERGDELELIIADRPQAQVSLDGASTFFGAIQIL